MISLKRKIYLTVFLSLIFFIQGAEVNAGETLVLGVHPYLPATELVKRFSPIAEYLSRKIGQPIIIKVARDYNDHIDQIGMDKLDIAYMGPAPYVRLVAKYGKKPILARLEIRGKPYFRGAIIKSKNSSVKRLSELKGKRFAFGDLLSTMSHLVPRYMLFKAGVGVKELSDYKFLHNHHNVALGVLIGDFDAGAVKEEVFYEYEKRGLKVINWSPSISEHLFVTASSIPGKTVRTLRKALYDLKDTPQGRAVLSAIKSGVTAMVPAADSDYDNLRLILRTLEEHGMK